MFNPRQRPMLLVADRLLGLRLSLNTPVVATAELPAGPARAAILVYAEAGERRFAVAVRALRSGTSVVYELEGENLNEATGWAVALDAAHSFGESMGFLFDDDQLADRSPAALRQALGRVREILAPPGPAEEESALAEPAEEAEILLDDAVEAEAQAVPPKRAQAVPPKRAGAEAEPAERKRAAVSLTKFRAAPAESNDAKQTEKPAGSAKSASRGAKLGRVRPVRLRSGDSQPPIGALLRLLAAF